MVFIIFIHLPTKDLLKKIWTLQIPARKFFYTHKIPTKKNFGPTKYPRERFLDPRNTHEKKFRIYEIPKRKKFGPTKYPWVKNSGTRNTYEGKWRNSTRLRRSSIARDSRNLAHYVFLLNQGHVQNLVKHLRWIFLRKLLTALSFEYSSADSKPLLTFSNAMQLNYLPVKLHWHLPKIDNSNSLWPAFSQPAGSFTGLPKTTFCFIVNFLTNLN